MVQLHARSQQLHINGDEEAICTGVHGWINEQEGDEIYVKHMKHGVCLLNFNYFVSSSFH